MALVRVTRHPVDDLNGEVHGVGEIYNVDPALDFYADQLAQGLIEIYDASVPPPLTPPPLPLQPAGRFVAKDSLDAAVAYDLRSPAQPLRIYTDEGLTGLDNASGLIPRAGAFVAAPDYDKIITPPGSDPVVQRVRTSPRGEWWVESYGAVPYKSSLGSGSTGLVSSTPAIKAAQDAAAAASGGGWPGVVRFGHGSFWLNDDGLLPLSRVDNLGWRGYGRLNTILYLASGVAKSIMKKTDVAGRYGIRDIGVGLQDRLSYAGIAPFPLLWLTSYFSTFENVGPINAWGDFMRLDGQGDRNSFRSIHGSGAGSPGCGIRIAGPPNSDFEARLENFACGMLVDVRATNGGSMGIISGRVRLDTESGTSDNANAPNIPNYHSIWLGASNFEVSGYALNGHILLDRQSKNNDFTGMEMIGGHIYDASEENYVFPVGGKRRRPQEHHRTSFFLPSSWTRDPDQSSRSVAPFTAVGGASFIKTDNPGSTIRVRSGKERIPLQISGPVGAGAYKTVDNVVAGQGHRVRLQFQPKQAGARAQLQVLDDASPTTVIADSGLITGLGGSAEFVGTEIDLPLQIPTGVTKLRLQLTKGDAAAIDWNYDEFIRTANSNPGFEGTYASGIAPGLTDGTGSGTPSESTNVFRTGIKAQRIAVMAGQSKSLYEDIGNYIQNVADPTALYLIGVDCQLESGGRDRAGLFCGSGATDIGGSAVQARAFAQGWPDGFGPDFEPLRLVLRPGGTAVGYNVGVGVASDASVAAQAVFDGLFVIPLKDDFGRDRLPGPVLDITSTPESRSLGTVGISARIRRIYAVCVVAASAQGPAIQIGIPGTPTYYGSSTPPATAAVGDELPILQFSAGSYSRSLNPPTHTDVRPGTPIMATWASQVPNGGKWQPFVELE